MEENTKRLFEFGPFRLDEEERQLRREGKIVPLTPKAFDLLVALLEQPGHLLAKDELIKVVWPDSFVEENNLTDNISRLRKALGDGEDGQKFIETIPKRGYRFVADVKRLRGGGIASEMDSTSATVFQAAASLPTSDQLAKKNSLGTHLTWRSTRLLLAFSLVLVVTAVPLYLSWKSRSRVPAVSRYTQVTSDGRFKRDAVVTDGARIFFSEQLGGQIALAQVSSASGETVAFQPSLSNANLLGISPDRSRLLVGRFEASAPECPLWVVPVTGGSPYRLGDVLAHSAAWAPDGEWITYATGGDLFQIRKDGSGSRKLLSVAGRVDWPRWSPDGSRLRFTVRGTGTLSPKLWEATADGSNPHPILPDWNSPDGECCGSWSADGKYFVFESVQNRVSNVWVLTEETGLFRRARPKPLQLTFGPMNFHAPAPSATGSQIFVIGKQPRGELIRYDTKTGQFVSYHPGLSAEGLNFSTDGEWVAYVTYPEGGLWRSKVDGTERLQLSFPPMRARMPRWSPEGKRIAFAAQLPGKPWKVYVVSVEGGSLNLLSPEERDERDAGWSPDGNSLVLSSRTPTTRWEIRQLNLVDNQPVSLPGATKMFSPRWSPDGRYLAALSLDSMTLNIFDFTNHQWKELIRTRVGHPAFSRDGKYIYFLDQFGNEPGIRRVRIADSKIESVADIRELRLVETFFGRWLGLAPDDSPLLLRDVGIDDIYALDFVAP